MMQKIPELLGYSARNLPLYAIDSNQIELFDSEAAISKDRVFYLKNVEEKLFIVRAAEDPSEEDKEYPFDFENNPDASFKTDLTGKPYLAISPFDLTLCFTYDRDFVLSEKAESELTGCFLDKSHLYVAQDGKVIGNFIYTRSDMPRIIPDVNYALAINISQEHIKRLAVDEHIHYKGNNHFDLIMEQSVGDIETGNGMRGLSIQHIDFTELDQEAKLLQGAGLLKLFQVLHAPKETLGDFHLPEATWPYPGGSFANLLEELKEKAMFTPDEMSKMMFHKQDSSIEHIRRIIYYSPKAE